MCYTILISNIPSVSHLSPLNPCRQVQVTEVPFTVHLPWFLQGFPKQGDSAKSRIILFLNIFLQVSFFSFIFSCKCMNLIFKILYLWNKQQLKQFTGAWTWLVTWWNSVKPEGLLIRFDYVPTKYISRWTF